MLLLSLLRRSLHAVMTTCLRFFSLLWIVPCLGAGFDGHSQLPHQCISYCEHRQVLLIHDTIIFCEVFQCFSREASQKCWVLKHLEALSIVALEEMIASNTIRFVFPFCFYWVFLRPKKNSIQISKQHQKVTLSIGYMLINSYSLSPADIISIIERRNMGCMNFSEILEVKAPQVDVLMCIKEGHTATECWYDQNNDSTWTAIRFCLALSDGELIF